MKKQFKVFLSFILISIIFIYINTAQAIILNDETNFISEISYNFLEDTNAFIITPKNGTELSYENTVEMFANYEKTIKTITDKNNIILENTNGKVSTGDKIQINTNEQFTTILYGDSTGDGEICTEKDVEIIKNDYLNRQKSEREYKIAADLCTDGKLNVKDIQKMLLKQKGKLTDGIVDELVDNQGIHTAIFVANDIEIAKVKFTLKDGFLSEKPVVPEKSGYKAEWEQYELLEEDIIINAIYALNEYEIIYEMNGGIFKDIPKSIYTIKDNSIKLPIPEKENFVFEGWYETADFTGNKIESLEGKCGDITLYAKYIEGKYKDNLNNYYLTLKEAIAAANELSTITSITSLLDTLETESITFTGTQTLTIDLNEKNIILEGAKIINNKNLIISGSGSLEIVSGTNLITNNGVFILESGTIKSFGTDAILNETGTTVVSGGYIEVTDGNGINNLSSGIVELTGGVIKVNTNTKSGVLNESSGIVKMSGGEIIGTGNGICNIASGEITIIGGIIDVLGDYAVSGNTGIVVIGTNKIIQEVSMIYPIIKGSNIGIQINEGILKIYDGIIKGAIGKSIVGDDIELLDGYEIKKEFDVIEDIEYETSVIVKKAQIESESVLESSDEKDIESEVLKENVEISIDSKVPEDNVEAEKEQEVIKENVEEDIQVEVPKDNVEMDKEEVFKENIEEDIQVEVKDNVEEEKEQEVPEENNEEDKEDVPKNNVEEKEQEVPEDNGEEDKEEAPRESVEEEKEQEVPKENIEADKEEVPLDDVKDEMKSDVLKETVEVDTNIEETKNDSENNIEADNDSAINEANIEVEESPNIINNLSTLDTELESSIIDDVIIINSTTVNT